MKNAIRCLLLSAGSMIGGFATVTPAVAQGSFADSLNFGVLVAPTFGRARVEPDLNNLFTDATGVGVTLVLSVEKPLSKHVHLSSEMNLIHLTEFSFDDDGSTSTGALLSFGVVLGDIKTPWRPYLSSSLGYSYIDIGDSGRERQGEELEPCFAFAPCFRPDAPRPGGHSQGLGYRVALGLGRFQSTAELSLPAPVLAAVMEAFPAALMAS